MYHLIDQSHLYSFHYPYLYQYVSFHQYGLRYNTLRCISLCIKYVWIRYAIFIHQVHNQNVFSHLQTNRI